MARRSKPTEEPMTTARDTDDVENFAGRVEPYRCIHITPDTFWNHDYPPILIVHSLVGPGFEVHFDRYAVSSALFV
jgi:hypothetical protein